MSSYIYIYLNGRGREEERGNRTRYRSQSWVENTNMTECTQESGYLQYINSDKDLPLGAFTGQYFRRHFARTSTSLIFLHSTPWVGRSNFNLRFRFLPISCLRDVESPRDTENFFHENATYSMNRFPKLMTTKCSRNENCTRCINLSSPWATLKYGT